MDAEDLVEFVGDIQMIRAAFAPGQSTRGIFGPFAESYFLACRDWEKAQREAREQLADRVRAASGNAVLSFEEDCDPFATQGGEQGIRVSVRGIAVRLEKWEVA